MTVTVRVQSVKPGKPLELSTGNFSSLLRLEAALKGLGCHARLRSNTPSLLLSAADVALARRGLAGWIWELDSNADPAVTLAESRMDLHTQARARVQALGEDYELAHTSISSFVPDGLLDPHQVIAVAAVSDPVIDGICIFDEQGLGKTLVGIAGFHAMRHRGLVRRALVLAPKNMLGEWERDFARFFGQRYKVSVISGTPAQRRRAIQVDADVFVANFEAAISNETALQSMLAMRTGGALLIVDESFHVKNPEARRTAAVGRLRRVARRCVVLCGTPAPNSPMDIIEQFNIADQGMTFQGASIASDPTAALHTIAHVVGERGVYLRRLKGDILLDLPGKTFTTIPVELAPAQRRMYSSLLDDYVEDLKRCPDAEFESRRMSFLAKRSALLRCCTDPRGVDERYDEVPGKRAALDALLEDLIATKGEKVVLWSTYRQAIDDAMIRYSKYGAVRIDGTVSDVGERRRAIQAFQEDEGVRLFVGNPAAAGAGITLHRARVAVYESLPIQAAAYFQSLDRVHRRGQTRPVEYFILLGEGTLESGEYDRLSRKAESSRQLLGDPVPDDVSREALLHEALASLRDH